MNHVHSLGLRELVMVLVILNSSVALVLQVLSEAVAVLCLLVVDALVL